MARIKSNARHAGETASLIMLGGFSPRRVSARQAPLAETLSGDASQDHEAPRGATRQGQGDLASPSVV